MTNPQYNFGDLVRVAGYYPQIFIVDGYREERYYYPDEQWSELVYELHGAMTLDWLEADEDDLTLVASAVNADAYLAHYRPPTDLQPQYHSFKEAEKMTNKRPRAKTHAEIVDGLLDDYNKYRELERVIGDGDYADKAAGVIAELKEITGGES